MRNGRSALEPTVSESYITTPEEEIRRLVRAISLAQSFRLYFARTDVVGRRPLMEAVAAQVEGPLEILEFPTEIDHLRQAITDRFGWEVSARVLFVTGLEWLVAGPEGEGSAFVQNLNASRDLFRQILKGPLVFWVSEHVLRAIQHGAPDFFSIASGLYLFPAAERATPMEERSPRSEFAEVARLLEELEEIEGRLAQLRAEDLEDRAVLLARKIDVLGSLGRFPEAEMAAEEAKRLVELLPRNYVTSLMLNSVTRLLRRSNRLAEAEFLIRTALQIDETNNGPEHPSVAIDLNSLALLLRDVGRLADAEPLMRRALEIVEASFGPESPSAATALNNLAMLLKDGNRLVEAESLMRRALLIDEARFGFEHPTVAIRLNNLAQVLQDTNHLAEAESLLRRALEIDEVSYGPNHPFVAIDLNNLAMLLKDANRLTEAELLMRRALDIDVSSYGPEHISVSTALKNLATILGDNDRTAEAEPLMRRALEIRRTKLGLEHPGTLDVEAKLARLRSDGRTPDEHETAGSILSDQGTSGL